MVDQLIHLAYNCSYSSKLSLTPEKENSMNIKVKAGLEVAGFIAATMVVITGIQIGLATAVEAFGIAKVITGLGFGLMSIAAYVAVSLLYDIRVAKLEYRAKLEEMTKK